MLRTYDRFKANAYFSASEKSHQKGETPLTQLNFDLISGFPLDYMHTICLGVVRRLLMFLKGSINECINSFQNIA